MQPRPGFLNDEPIGTFMHEGDGDLAQSVERDAVRVATRHGYVPSIRRYEAHIDPRRDVEAARAVVMQAFHCAGPHAGALASCWRTAHPAWRDCIDACLAAHQLLRIPITMVEESASWVGQPLRDGRLRYELIECIGQGADGEVFRAIDHALSQGGDESCVAVKIVSCERSTRDSLLAEAALARRVSHGGIARVLDAGILPEAEAGCYIVTELVSGVPLHVWPLSRAAPPGSVVRSSPRCAMRWRPATSRVWCTGIFRLRTSW